MLLELLLIFLRSTAAYEDVVTDLLIDFIKAQNTPSTVVTYNCQSKEENAVFLKKLINVNVSNKILKPHDPILNHSKEENNIFQTFIIDLHCDGAKNVLEQADRLNLFRQPFKWIILGSNFNEELADYYLRLDSRIFTIDNTKPGDFLRVNAMYKLDRNSKGFMQNYIAEWNVNEGFTYLNTLQVSRMRKNLLRSVLNLSYVMVNQDTLNHLEDYRDKHIDSITKLNWILIHHLVDIVNATTNVPVFRTTWGYRNASTGIYSGMIGDLQLGHAEIGGTACFFTLDRIDIVDFIAATNPTYMKFIFRAPPLSYVTNVFTLPFDTYVWYCCFVFLAVVLFIVYMIMVWEWKGQSPSGTPRPSLKKPGEFMDIVLMEVGAVTQQGTELVPKSYSGRIATIFTLLIWMFLYTSYSANIVALLQSTTESIRTLEDLLKSRISLGVEDIVYAHYYFENAQEPTRKAIYQQKVAPKGQKPNFMQIEDGIRRVQQGFFAFHVELSSGYKVVGELFQESEKCGLKEIAYVNLIEPWVPMRKNSPYKEIFKVGMNKIGESGVQRREADRIYTKKPACHGRGNNFGSVGIIDCYAAFLIFGAGIACSLICLVIEMILMRHKTRYTHGYEENEISESDALPRIE